MNKKDNLSLYEQQEDRIRNHSTEFITLLTERGFLGDQKIDNEKIRNARKVKQKNWFCHWVRFWEKVDFMGVKQSLRHWKKH